MKTQDQIVSELIEMFGDNVKSTDVRSYCAMNDLSYASIVDKIQSYKSGRGSWTFTGATGSVDSTIESIQESYTAPAAKVNSAIVKNIFDSDETLIPKKDPNFVPFGPFKDLRKIVASNLFYPTFITGLSGNGKTVSVEQVCAQLKRELIRVNITIETDADDLIGGFRLQNGDTVWHDGPVVEAMRRGAILLLDEVDLASNKIMVLQSVLEGKPLYLKKISKVVHPKEGFNIIATANTKGKGSSDGRFIGTNVMNEAFLERFAVTIEQSYPTPNYETKILSKLAASIGLNGVDDFIKRLVTWSEDTRKTFINGGIDELISTRRLTLIIQAYKIFGNKATAVKYAVSRFDDEVKDAFIKQYDKIDETFRKEEELAKRLEAQEENSSSESTESEKKTITIDEIKEIKIYPVDTTSVTASTGYSVSTSPSATSPNTVTHTPTIHSSYSIEQLLNDLNASNPNAF
jgi:MoxR-like ATPase